MVLKNKNQVKPVGFGTGAGRFTFTSHPKLDTNGVHHKSSRGCDPARYYPKDIDEIFRVNKTTPSNKEPWTCQRETEDWCANLGYRNQNILASRRRQASFLGPAWHDVSEPPKYKPACNNVSFGRAPRFKTSKSNCTPGPGTYHKVEPYKVQYGPHSSRPTFEREPPCRYKDTALNFVPDPGRYHIIDKDSIEMKPKKVVSLLGPYKLFTVARKLSTIISKTNKSKVKGAKTWPLSLPGSFETYKKSPYGKFNKTNMQTPYHGRNALIDLCMRIHKAGEPGPGDYNVVPRKEFTQYKYAFNSSDNKPRGYNRAVVWPAVGRYNIKIKGCGIFGQGHRHIFKCKAQRTIGAYPPPQFNDF